MAAASLIWGVGSAAAGQYTVWSCRGPEGAPISAAAWRIQIGNAAAPDVTAADDCASGGSLRLEMSPTAPILDHKPFGEALFEPPPGTLIPSFEIWRYAAADDGPITPDGEDDFGSGLREWLVYGGGEGSLAECGVQRVKDGMYWHDCQFGTPLDPLDPSNLVDEHTWVAETEPGEGVPAREMLGLWVGCIRAHGGCEPPVAGPGAVFELFGSAITIEDDHAPALERVEGSLAEAAPVSGVGSLFVTADDEGGGVAGFEFSVDGAAPQRVAVGNGKGACEEPFTLPRPCPATATKGLALDTATLAPGAHTVGGAVLDAAGNATPFGPLVFTVAARDDGRPEGPQGGVAAAKAEGGMPNNGTPAVATPRLRIHPTAPPRRAGRPARLRGTLTAPDGTPIAGARLLVEVTELGGRRGSRRTVRTDAQGHFAFKVGGGGARSVVVSYSPTLGGPASRTAAAVVRSPLSLRLKTHPRRVRNGQTVHFVGRLRGAGRAARGATVEIQAIAGGRWTTVETATAGARGQFRWSHRFRYVERNALFSFRAVVPRTPGWPWPTVRSPRISVPIKGAPR